VDNSLDYLKISTQRTIITSWELMSLTLQSFIKAVKNHLELDNLISEAEERGDIFALRCYDLIKNDDPKIVKDNQFLLAERSLKGENVGLSPEETSYLHNKGTEDANSLSKFQLATSIFLDGEKAKEKPGAVKIFKEFAKKRSALAQFYLGVIYHTGDGVKRNEKVAAKWYDKASVTGHDNFIDYSNFLYFMEYCGVQSLRDAAEMYLEITGKIFSQFYFNTPPLFGLDNPNERRKEDVFSGFKEMIAKSSEQNNSLSDLDEINKKFPGFTIAAMRGDRDAQFLIGRAYHIGRVVAKNDDVAFKWLKISAENGCVEAQKYLGNMYQSGDGVPKDLNEAAKWLRMAGELTEKPDLKIV
jgi:TPR repeat protein